MKAYSGLKTLMYGTAAGIDPHRINRTKLPSWYIAGPCYRSTPCQFSSFPSRSALRVVGQSSRTSLVLLPASLTSVLPQPLSCLRLPGPAHQSRFKYADDYNHLSGASRGLEGKEHVAGTKWPTNQGGTEFRKTIKAYRKSLYPEEGSDEFWLYWLKIPLIFMARGWKQWLLTVTGNLSFINVSWHMDVHFTLIWNRHKAAEAGLIGTSVVDHQAALLLPPIGAFVLQDIICWGALYVAGIFKSWASFPETR